MIRAVPRKEWKFPSGSREAYCFARGALATFAVYDRDRLLPGMSLDGPVIVDEGTSTTIFFSDQCLLVDEYRQLVIRRKL